MSNERGWKDGVYNPGLPTDSAYMERKAKEFAEAGIEIPEIKGVVLKGSKTNPMLTVRENFQLDQIRTRKDSDPVVSEIGLISGALHEMAVGNGKIYAKGSMDRLKHHTLCPEVEVINAFLFQFAGHIWKHVHSNWHDIGITGTVEPFIPTADDLSPFPVHLGHDFDIPLNNPYQATGGRSSHIAQFVDLTYETSQGIGRNESLAVYVGNLDIADTYPKTHLVPEEILTPDEQADREQAIQEASEGKLDYLLEGTQWDPRNRK